MNGSILISHEEIEAQTYETPQDCIVAEMGFSYSKPLTTRVYWLLNLLVISYYYFYKVQCFLVLPWSKTIRVLNTNDLIFKEKLR